MGGDQQKSWPEMEREVLEYYQKVYKRRFYRKLKKVEIEFLYKSMHELAATEKYYLNRGNPRFLKLVKG